MPERPRPRPGTVSAAARPSDAGMLVWVGFLVAVLVLLGIAARTWDEFKAAQGTSNLTQRTVEVLAQIETLFGSIRDAETGQRGYLLTADESYLKPYLEARNGIPKDLSRLQKLVADSPSQQDRLAHVRSLIDAKLAEVQSTIDARRDQGLVAALAIVETDAGKRRMDQIRALIGEMEAEERRLLLERTAERGRARRAAEQMIIFGSLFAAALVAVSAAVSRRQMQRRAVAERKARESEQRLGVTLRSIGDAVIATDVEGHVTFMNAVAERLTGWSIEEARARPLEEVFHIINETTRAVVTNPVEKVLELGMVVGLANHTVMIARDGTERPIDDSAAPIHDGVGDLMGVVLVFHDVSGRREAEESRERFVRAEAANQAKDEFLALLSHELRSPLNAMLGWVRVLQRGIPDEATRERAFGVLGRNIDLQTNLINELLDVSRIVSGKLQLTVTPINLVPITQGAVDTHRTSAEAKQVALVYEPPPDDVLCVIGDDARLQQVIGNLLNNAIRFTPQGGQVHVRLERRGDSACLTVRDTGEGIRADLLPHVFERFKQAETHAARRHGGLGIGLAVVQHLVERHGGQVSAASDGAGCGATFTVLLPLATDQVVCEHAADKAGVDPLDASEKLTVLLVEDDADTLDALTFALEQSGIRVVAAQSAGEALAAFERERPTVIVSDISMPDGDGYGLIRAIRARDGGRTPAVALTSLVSRADREAALEAGFDEHLTKPLDPDSLVGFVRVLAKGWGGSSSRRA